MTEIKITIQSQDIERLLTQLGQRTADLRPAMSEIGDDLTAKIALCFREQKSPDGKTWKPLSPVTKFNRAKRVSGGKVYTKNNKVTTAKFTRAYVSANPLNDTGLLKNSIHKALFGNSVVVGSDRPQAAMMNFGGKKSQFPHLWGDIPARPFMPTAKLPADWERDIIEILERHLGLNNR